MIEMFVGRNTGTAKIATINAAYLNGIFAKANPAVNERINCRIRMPKVKKIVLKKIRGVITESASA